MRIRCISSFEDAQLPSAAKRIVHGVVGKCEVVHTRQEIYLHPGNVQKGATGSFIRSPAIMRRHRRIRARAGRGRETGQQGVSEEAVDGRGSSRPLTAMMSPS